MDAGTAYFAAQSAFLPSALRTAHWFDACLHVIRPMSIILKSGNSARLFCPKKKYSASCVKSAPSLSVVLLMIPKEVASSINWSSIIYSAVVFMVGLPEVITGLMFKHIEEE